MPLSDGLLRVKSSFLFVFFGNKSLFILRLGMKIRMMKISFVDHEKEMKRVLWCLLCVIERLENA